jgi:serine protease Do
VLRVNLKDALFPATRATGAEPQQGERVFAFGSPFGFKFSMSQGIISGLGRDPQQAMEFGGYTNFIQTDAAVNPGNSGGPLVDVKGRVIGMNVAIATGRDTQGTTEGQSAGISFAIPVAVIENVVDQLIAKGQVSRGFLGIEFARSEIPIEEDGFQGVGVQVGRVIPGGPSARAGLHRGDVITAINGRPISSGEALRSTVSLARPGQEIEVRYWRNGSADTTRIELAEMPADAVATRSVGNALLQLGLALRATSEGLEVAQVLGDNAKAAEAGFEKGQLITRVEDVPVKTFNEFAVALMERGLLLGKPVSVTVVSNDADKPSDPKDLVLQVSR